MRPEQAKEVDHKAELGVVLGTRARRVPVADTLDHVAGYVCANEVSARDTQFANGQWTRGKSVDTSGNRWQMEQPRKRPKQGEEHCRGLRPVAGKSKW